MKEVYVDNIDNLLKEIDSNKKIIIKKGTYVINNTSLINDRIRFEEVSDGYELIVEGVNNLVIEGEDNESTNILAKPRYANVITFINCNNIKLSGLTCGHTEAEGYCTGGVLKFKSCYSVNLNDSIYFGCGTEGIIIDDCSLVNANELSIKECTYGIMTINNSKDVTFNSCLFYNNCEFDLISILYSSNIIFNKCSIYDNLTNHLGYSLLKILGGTNIQFNEVDIYNNKVGYLMNNKEYAVFNNCNISSNIYDISEFEEDYSFNINEFNEIYFNNDPNNKNKILYIEQEEIRMILGEEEKIINKNMPSRPDLIDNTLIYSCPFGFELIGDLYVYDINASTEMLILKSEDISQQKSIKKSVWQDDKNILFIFGQAFGTATRGGNLYRYSLADKKFEEILKCDEYEEISDIIYTEDRSTFFLEVTRHDKEYDNYSKVYRVLNF